MLQDFIKKKLFENFVFSPSQDQVGVLHAIAEFLVSSHEVFVLRGYAGTGKTTLVQTIVKTLHELSTPSCLLAPTGRAAKVLGSYTGKPAFTIHKKIYRQQSSAAFSKFALNFNASPKSIFIIDEASMLSNNATENSMFGSGCLLDDLFSFVFSQKQCKIILIGDEAQLPPIGVSVSPALDIEFIQHAYLKECAHSSLYQVVRQTENSGILNNATIIREWIDARKNMFPNLQPADDVISVSGSELLELLESSHSKVGVEDTIVITRSNKQANRYNEGIRRTILWRDSVLSVGDYVMIVKNNYFWIQNCPEIDFIANGDIAQITAITKYEDLYGFSFANVCLRFSDYQNTEIEAKVLLTSLQTDSPSLSKEQSEMLYSEVQADYADIANKRKRYEMIKNNEYFNALQIKFAYAVTCHKAQGGQWKHVYIDHGYLPEETVSIDFLRWLYTAITRASKKVYLVNFKKEFFNS